MTVWAGATLGRADTGIGTGAGVIIGVSAVATDVSVLPSGEAAATDDAGEVLAAVWLADGSLDSVDASFCAAGVIESG